MKSSDSSSSTVREAVMAKRLAALGSTARLQLLRVLVRAGDAGLTVGQIQEATGMPSSTQFHHLSALVDADVVERERHGKEVVNRVKFASVREISAFLLEDCCKGGC